MEELVLTALIASLILVVGFSNGSFELVVGAAAIGIPLAAKALPT